MKKKINPLVPAAVVLVVLCAAYGLITWNQHKKADALAGQTEDNQIYVTNLQGLTSISWEKDGQQGLAFKKEGDTWYYQSDKDCPIRQYTVTTLADTLARLSAGRQLETPDSLDSYGLNPPAVKFSITSEDGTSQTLMIGNQVAGTGDTAAGYASTAAEYYACLEGGSQVYTIGNYLTETSGKGLYDFVETESLPYVAGTDIKEITVTRNGATRGFSKKTVDADNNIAWYKGSPDDEANRLPDNSDLNNLAEAISGLSIQSCTTYKATDEELGSYGLSTPDMTLSWTYEKGGDTGTVTLFIGSPNDEGTGYYTRMDDSRAINLISKDAVEKCLNAVYPE